MTLNYVIWSLAPKEEYVFPLGTSLAISLNGVCLFNYGMQYTYSNLIEMAGIDTTYTMLQKWAKINMYRVYNGNYAASKDRKEQRNMRKRVQIKKQDAFQHLEGVQYQSQSFYEKGDQGTNGDKVEEVVKTHLKKENTVITL